MQVRGGSDIQPAGTKTVFPDRSPSYLFRAWSAVEAASGMAAASSNDSDGGFRAMRRSGHTAYSLHEPLYAVSKVVMGYRKYMKYLYATLEV